MPNAKPALRTLSLSHARRRWFVSQGLASPEAGQPEEILRRSGWLRTLGGIDVYLAAWARVRGLRRADLDRTVEKRLLQVVPAVRGCIYLVPRPEVPLVLRIADELSRPRTEYELGKVGSGWGEVQDVADGVLAELQSRAHTTDSLRRALPAGLLRSLGDLGKKVGMSSVLPVALRQLEFAGRIERRLADGRLDSERYTWQLLDENLFAGAKLPADADARLTELARLFFQHAGPSTVREFAEWSGLGQKDARAAVESLDLTPVRIEGHADEAWASARDLADLEEPPESSAVTLLSFADNYLSLHGGPAAVTDPAQHGLTIPVWGNMRQKTMALGDAKHISLRPVLVGDRLAGFWEYDPDAQTVVTTTFSTPPKGLKARAEELGQFLRGELGHGRSFNLDTDAALRERVALVGQI